MSKQQFCHGCNNCQQFKGFGMNGSLGGLVAIASFAALNTVIGQLFDQFNLEPVGKKKLWQLV